MINKGSIEVYQFIDGTEFLIECLDDGSIINYRAFIMEDVMEVYMRCKTPVSVLKINIDKIE
jgi:hypothetical protein